MWKATFAFCGPWLEALLEHEIKSLLSCLLYRARARGICEHRI